MTNYMGFAQIFLNLLFYDCKTTMHSSKTGCAKPFEVIKQLSEKLSQSKTEQLVMISFHFYNC